MNVPDYSGSIIAFKDTWPSRSEAHSQTERPPDPEWLDYCRVRERTERAAAKNARSAAARCIHQELAQAYEQVIRCAAKSRS